MARKDKKPEGKKYSFRISMAFNIIGAIVVMLILLITKLSPMGNNTIVNFFFLNNSFTVVIKLMYTFCNKYVEVRESITDPVFRLLEISAYDTDLSHIIFPSLFINTQYEQNGVIV